MPVRRRVMPWAAAIAVATLSSACQTVPENAGFGPRQIEALEEAGFAEDDGSYYLGLENRVLFAFDRSDLKPETEAMLSRLANALVSVGVVGAMIQGHTDSVGDDEYNRRLSLLRAEAVKIALVRHGMARERIRTWGAGKDDPIASNDTEAGRSQNRRVVIVVTPSDAAPVN